MTLLIALPLGQVEAVAAAATQRAIEPLAQELQSMALNLDKLSADVDRVKSGVGDLRSQIAELKAATDDPSQQQKIDALDGALVGLFPDAPAPSPAPGPDASGANKETTPQVQPQQLTPDTPQPATPDAAPTPPTLSGA